MTGVQFVMMDGETTTPQWFADNWDMLILVQYLSLEHNLDKVNITKPFCWMKLVVWQLKIDLSTVDTTQLEFITVPILMMLV